MGTETRAIIDGMNTKNWLAVKLNNPLMGTETTWLFILL